MRTFEPRRGLLPVTVLLLAGFAAACASPSASTPPSTAPPSSRRAAARPVDDLDLVRGQAVDRQRVAVEAGLVGEVHQVAFRLGEDLDHRALDAGLEAVLGHRLSHAHDVVRGRAA